MSVRCCHFQDHIPRRLKKAGGVYRAGMRSLREVDLQFFIVTNIHNIPGKIFVL